MEWTHDHLRSEICLAQDKHEQYAIASHTRAPRFQVGSQDWLSMRNIKPARTSKKPDHMSLGPYPMCKVIGSHTYRLTLPPSMTIHPVFYVALLETASLDPVPGQVMPRPPPVVIEGGEEWKVEEVLFSRTYRRLP